MPIALDVGHRDGEASGPHLYDAAGRIIYSTAAGTTAVTAAATTAGQMPYWNGSTLAWTTAPTAGQLARWDGNTWSGAGDLRGTLPTGGLVENFPRALVAGNQAGILTAGQLLMTAIPVVKGMTITTLSWWSSTTALGSGTNQWAALFTSARSKVAISADATSGAWAATARKDFTMTTPYPVTADGTMYAGLCVTASIMPSLAGLTVIVAGLGLEAPLVNGTADSSLTNPASCPTTAIALTIQAKTPYVLAS